MRTAILLVAYGTSNPQSRESLREFEKRCRCRFPGLPVRWAYTSLILREIMVSKKQKSDSVKKALLRLHYEKFTKVAIQPLQTICGFEHESVCAAARQAALETGLDCRVGLPLLVPGASPETVARALLSHLPGDRQAGEDVVFMGHGARHKAVCQYEELAAALRNLDPHAHVGTMNGATLLDDILPRLSSRSVWLLPLLSIIGKHALRDMAGDGPDSWRSRIESQGHSCLPVLRGMAESAAITDIWLDHLEAALKVAPS